MSATTSPAIAAHARALAEAERAHQSATAALVAAEAHLTRIGDRTTDLVAQRAAIVARRAAGEHQPDDAGALALIAADVEGLESMIPDAEAVIAAARQPAYMAAQTVIHDRARLVRAEAEAAEVALIEHASRLDELLLATLSRLQGQEKTLSRPRPVWGPSLPLIDALRRRQAVLGTL